MKVLGIDIGGSGIKGAPVDLKTGRPLAERVRVETPAPAKPAAMASAVAEIAGRFNWRGHIGVGFPGVICGSTALTAANLDQSWVGTDVGRLISRATGGCPVSVLNDADAAGIAEVKFGAGRREPGTVLLLTLGTGIGSALFYRGVLYPNSELGHLPWRGRAAEKFAAASVRKRRDLSWPEWGARLNEYVAVLEEILWPDLIILGGGVSAKYRKFFPYLKLRAKVVPAKLFNEAGIVGAALAVTHNPPVRHGRARAAGR